MTKQLKELLWHVNQNDAKSFVEKVPIIIYRHTRTSHQTIFHTDS